MSDRIINTYDQNVAAGGDRIIISYRGRGDYRSMQVPGWYVWRLVNGREKVTDPKAHWADYGKKFFSSSGWGERKLVLETAIKWANETFGPRDFVRNRMGDYVEREVNEKFPIPKRERVVRT